MYKRLCIYTLYFFVINRNTFVEAHIELPEAADFSYTDDESFDDTLPY